MTFIDDLQRRYDELLQLKKQVEQELTAVGNGLQVAQGLPGRPKLPPRFTRDEVIEAHKLHQQGVDTEWVLEGERQYKREKKREERARKKGDAA
jgi:hypothetical protein